ncbi:unnamed protein product [Symbiodinium natans]|uniref:Uncharacterized protein n=1 Tax=Symbiodinium natans TaxID=878477 RepID=A0A812MCR9_9DINO|nr:unnamed protein product [Symbiodinium natans]
MHRKVGRKVLEQHFAAQLLSSDIQSAQVSASICGERRAPGQPGPESSSSRRQLSGLRACGADDAQSWADMRCRVVWGPSLALRGSKHRNTPTTQWELADAARSTGLVSLERWKGNQVEATSSICARVLRGNVDREGRRAL